MTGSHEITVSEAMGLHELMLQDATMIDKLAVYVHEAQSRDLESIFQTNLRKFEQNYNELIGFAGGESHFAGTAGTSFSPGRVQSAGSQTASHQTVRPQPAGRLQDRTMLMDCLVACKQLAVSSVTVATECSNISLRRTLVDIARHHLEMAYDLYKVAEQHGWYPELKAHENPGQWLRSTHLPISGTAVTNGWRGYEQTAYNTAPAYSTEAVNRAPVYPEHVPVGTAGGYEPIGQYGTAGQFGNAGQFGATGQFGVAGQYGAAGGQYGVSGQYGTTSNRPVGTQTGTFESGPIRHQAATTYGTRSFGAPSRGVDGRGSGDRAGDYRAQ